MKKITFFVHNVYSIGGVERVLSLIANELSKKYEVEIISLYKTQEKPFFYLNEKIKLKNILGEKIYNPKKYILYLLYKIKKFFKNYKTDFFVATGIACVPLTMCMKNKAKYIAWEHCNSFAMGDGKLLIWGRKLAAKYADIIVVLTQKDMKNNIEKFCTEDKIVQIYNPIQYVKLNSSYNLESKKIISCGRICNQKGFDILIDVATKVFDKHPDWEWHIYGDGEDKEKVSQLIKLNCLENNVKLMGQTNQMSELYSEYSMYVMTSRFEGFAMVNIEAHYAKLPIVSFNCNCGPDEIIQDGINGYLIECFDIDKMAEKINYLIEHEELRKDMSDNTYLDKEKLRMSNIINEWEKILK